MIHMGASVAAFSAGLLGVAYCLFGCANPGRSTSKLNDGEWRTIFVGKITSVDLRPDRGLAEHRPWVVSADVVSVERDESGRLKPGDHVLLYIHSVVESFGDRESAVVNKRYKVFCRHRFTQPYQGAVWAERMSEAASE